MSRRQQPSFLLPAEPRCAPGPTTRPGLSQPPGRVRGLAPEPRVSASNARPPSPPRCAWTGTSSAVGPNSAGSPSAGAGCGPAPGAPRPRGCRCPWQRPPAGARRRPGCRRRRRPPAPQTSCPAPESRARGCPPRAAGPWPALGPEGGRGAARRWPGKDALVAAAPATAAAAEESTGSQLRRSRFLEDND